MCTLLIQCEVGRVNYESIGAVLYLSMFSGSEHLVHGARAVSTMYTVMPRPARVGPVWLPTVGLGFLRNTRKHDFVRDLEVSLHVYGRK